MKDSLPKEGASNPAPRCNLVNKLMLYMVRSFDRLMAHHERNQRLTVRPEFFDKLWIAFSKDIPAGMTLIQKPTSKREIR
jgi:hypothetical protein